MSAVFNMFHKKARFSRPKPNYAGKRVSTDGVRDAELQIKLNRISCEVCLSFNVLIQRAEPLQPLH